MILNELANQVKKIRGSQTKDIQSARTKNMMIGVGIGSAVGVAAGLLFAPKSGRETRHGIADQTCETVKNLKENVAEAKDRIFDAAAEKFSPLHEVGKKDGETEKEGVKKPDDDKNKDASK